MRCVEEMYRLSAIMVWIKRHYSHCATLEKETVCFAKTSVNFYNFTRRHVSEDNALCNQFRENRSSNSYKSVC
jgi:hypothetical protein